MMLLWSLRGREGMKYREGSVRGRVNGNEGEGGEKEGRLRRMGIGREEVGWRRERGKKGEKN